MLLTSTLTSKVGSFSIINGVPCVIRLVENPILIAVSCLSPVNTQTLMSAFMRAAIVSGTYKNTRYKLPTISTEFVTNILDLAIYPQQQSLQVI